MKTKILADFQICISVPLKEDFQVQETKIDTDLESNEKWRTLFQTTYKGLQNQMKIQYQRGLVTNRRCPPQIYQSCMWHLFHVCQTQLQNFAAV